MSIRKILNSQGLKKINRKIQGNRVVLQHKLWP